MPVPMKMFSGLNVRLKIGRLSGGGFGSSIGGPM
jgi:hypothetical protein